MAYKLDKELEFLQYMDDKSLDSLVETLIRDKDGELRLTESITSNDLYKKFSPQHSNYWELIAGELQSFGGNSFVNIFRGGGVQYKEILCEVCDKMGVNYNKNSNVINIEQNLFMKILEDSMKDMSTEELKSIVEELNLKTQTYTSQAVMAAMQVAIKQSGFFVYKMAAIIVNAVLKALFGRGLTFVGTGIMMRSISAFAGPIGWAITAAWTAFDVAGPAFRVTIPAVIQVAFLRQQYINKNIIEEELLNESNK
ncbi:DUF3944 domain-containing protein [Aliarcobacter butzleri]|uniref:DUF3944 domain-containing protein n=1 Tax=Aliarcobacter butzleri TaxID=28197 RepID=UPI00263C10B2|nr:DUF3944 domain-containing protein [Aliarcobacter butzleri]MDN5112692.1 DUF3944 domain-containing protein [Aliarcobacter butzleri]